MAEVMITCRRLIWFLEWPLCIYNLYLRCHVLVGTALSIASLYQQEFQATKTLCQ
jgi:hypothetical protein